MPSSGWPTHSSCPVFPTSMQVGMPLEPVGAMNASAVLPSMSSQMP
jgi:hypothetical protein